MDKLIDRLLTALIWYCDWRWRQIHRKVVGRFGMDCDKLIDRRNRWSWKKSNMVHKRYAIRQRIRRAQPTNNETRG